MINDCCHTSLTTMIIGKAPHKKYWLIPRFPLFIDVSVCIHWLVYCMSSLVCDTAHASALQYEKLITSNYILVEISWLYELHNMCLLCPVGYLLFEICITIY